MTHCDSSDDKHYLNRDMLEYQSKYSRRKKNYNIQPTSIAKQISSYHQTIRSTLPQSPNESFFALAWWQTCSCCLLSKDGVGGLTECQPACPETYLKASVCVAQWAEPHGRQVNEAQVQLIRGRRSVACNNKGRKCRNMTWNTKLQNKMKQICF